MKINFNGNFKLYLSVFIFFWALFALTNTGFDYSEGGYHYDVAENIIKTGNLGFDSPKDGIFTVAPNGKTYASHEIGNTVFMLPTAFVNVVLENALSGFLTTEKLSILKDFIRSFQFGTYSAITLTAFFGILQIGFGQQTISNFLATLGLGVTTYFWTFTRESYDAVLCCTLLTLALLFLLLFKQTGKQLYIIAAFVCLGFGFITRISIVIPIAAAFGYIVLVSRGTAISKLKNIGLALLTTIPFFLWQCWYNNLRTGFFYLSPIQTDEKYKFANTLDGNIFVGLQGFLLSPGKSIFVYAPLLILSLFLFRKFFKEYTKETLYIVAIAIPWFLLHARLRNWYGAWGWGPRHLLPILPLLFLPFAANIEYVLKKTSLKISAIVLASFGFLLALCSIISSWYWRTKLADKAGMLGDDIFIWGFWNSQPVDMLKGTVRNLLTYYWVITDSPAIKNQNLWYLNAGMREYGSFTLNIWPNSVTYLGIPWYLIAPCVIFLLFLMYQALRNILSAGSQNVKSSLS